MNSIIRKAIYYNVIYNRECRCRDRRVRALCSRVAPDTFRSHKAAKQWLVYPAQSRPRRLLCTRGSPNNILYYVGLCWEGLRCPTVWTEGCAGTDDVWGGNGLRGNCLIVFVWVVSVLCELFVLYDVY